MLPILKLECVMENDIKCNLDKCARFNFYVSCDVDASF